MSGLRSWAALPEGEHFATVAYSNGMLPKTPVGRIDFVMTLLRGFPILDDFGQPTGEFTEPFITKEDARRLLEGIE